jgi:hypothetical protein
VTTYIFPMESRVAAIPAAQSLPGPWSKTKLKTPAIWSGPCGVLTAPGIAREGELAVLIRDDLENDGIDRSAANDAACHQSMAGRADRLGASYGPSCVVWNAGRYHSMVDHCLEQFQQLEV